MKQLLLVCAVLGFGAFAHADDLKPGDAAPCVSLNHLNQNGTETVRSTCQGDLVGQKVVLEFFATDCEYCVENLPKWTDLAAKYFGRVTFRLMGIDQKPKALRDFFAKHDFSKFEIGFDSRLQAFDAFKLYGTPTIVVIDADRKIKLVHIGTIENDADMQEIEKAILE